MKKFISALLVVMMLVSMLPANVFAAETETVVLDLTSNTYRTEYDANAKVVYSNNGITLTNGKGSYSNTLREQGNGNTDAHVRLYAGTTLAIECEGMTQIVFSCPTATYATALLNSINANSDPFTGTAAASDTTVTVNFGTPTDRLYVSALTAQSRLTQVEVTKSAGGSETETPACTHESTEESGYEAPGCTTPGMSATVTCTACGEVVTAGQEIAPTGHSYVDGACSVCGKKEAVTATAELSLANQTYRTSASDTQQVYANNNITLTYNKGTYANALRDNAGDTHLRLYVGTNFTVEFPMNMTQVVFNCVGGYEEGLPSDIPGATVTANGTVITVVLNTPATSLTVPSITKQTRINSLVVTYEVNDAVCLHEETEVQGYEAPTCTTEGATGNTVCVACGEVVKESEVLPISHGDNETYTEGAKEPGCETEGATGTVYCSACDEVVTESTVIPATGHKYDGDTCTVCGQADPDYSPDAPAVTGYVQVTDVADITAGGEFVIVANNGGTYLALGTSISGKIVPTTVTIDGSVVTTEEPPVWEIKAVSNGIALYNGSSYLSYNSSTNFKSDTAPYAWVVEAASEGTFYITSAVTTRGIVYQLAGGKFGAYATSNRDKAGEYVGALLLYKLVEEVVDPNACTHELTEVTAGYPATCTAAGKEDTLSCKCGQNVQEGAAIEALGHAYDDDYCTRCNIINPEATKQAEAIDGLPAAGDQVIFYNHSGKFVMGVAANNDRMSALKVTKANGKIPYSATHTAVMTVEQVGDYFRFKMGDQYLTSGATGSSLCFAALPAEGETDLTLWEITPAIDYTWGVNIRSVNAIFKESANQYIEYYNNQFYPYSFDGVKFTNSFQLQIGLVNKITLTEDVDGLTYEGKLNLDLNGFKATNVVADELVVWDSSATSTTAGTGSLTTECAVAVDNTVDGVRYIALKGDDGAYTFHVLELNLTNVTLRTNKAGVYYKGEMACDEVLAAQIECHGIAVSIVGMPTADFANEANTAATKIYGAPEGVFTSGSVTNIFREGLSAEKNAARGEMVIYGNSYIQLVGGTVLMGSNQAQKSLKDIMVYLDANYASLEAADQENALAFYETWADAMGQWNLTNLAAAPAPSAPETEEETEA